MAQRADTRRTLLIVAISLSVLSGLVLAFLVVRASLSPSPIDSYDSEAAESIFAPIPGQRGQTGIASGGSGLFIQIMDRRDPTRLAMEIRSTQMDPIGPDLYRVDKPDAWIFMKDGTSVHIIANEGTLVLPDRAREPEQGTLIGGVMIRQFPLLGRRADPETDSPETTFTSETLSFDLTLGEVSTPDRILVTTAQGELAGTGMRMNINEPLERIDLFRLQKGEYLRISQRSATEAVQPDPAEQPSPPQANRNDAAPVPPATTASGQTAGARPAARPDPIESFYRAVFKDQVVLTQRGRTINGDQLEVWTRLVDNKLASDAIPGGADPLDRSAEQEQPESAQPGTPRTLALTEDGAEPSDGERIATDRVPDPLDSTEPAPPVEIVAELDTSADVLLTWTGEAEIRPLTSRPEMLSKDEIAARFTAERTGRVMLRDEASDASAATGAMDYFVTRRQVILASPGITGVELTSTGRGIARLGRLELNLGTGIGFAPGAGMVENANGRARVTWNEQADLIFETDENGMTGVLREAMTAGSVRAQRDGSTLEGDFVRTVFIASSSGELKLQRLAARGQVRTSDGQRAGGTCAALDVLFDPNDPSEDPIPTDIVARGNARFFDDQDRIDAEVIDASLMNAEQGGVTIRRLHTFGATRITRVRDGVVVSGGEVLLHEDRQSARVSGPNAVVERQGVRITAAGSSDTIHLDGMGRSANVDGAGSFSRETRNADGTLGRLNASWTESMEFDDYAGTLVCVGQVAAVYQPEPLRRDAVQGRRVEASFEPFKPENGEQPADLENQPADARTLLTFKAYGEAIQGPTAAAVESIRLEPVQGAEPRLARVLRLTGHLIDVDQTAGTLHVPGAGVLIVSDQRQEIATDRRASAAFDWKESFVYNRATGNATMIGSVEMRHRRRADEPLTELKSDRLRAVLLDPQRGNLDADPAGEASLRSARAEGNVSLFSGTREALANTIDYDAVNNTASIAGLPGGLITMIDTQRTGVVTRAGRIFWDMARDRIDIIDAGPFRGAP